MAAVIAACGGRETKTSEGDIDADALQPPAADSLVRSASWLASLPDGEEKRRFILDCTGCHQFNSRITRLEGRPRTEAEWAEAITRMLGYAGATTGFPVISSYRNPQRTAAWLAPRLAARPADQTLAAAPARITEFRLPEPQDLPHDIQVAADGSVIATGMMTHRMYVLAPAAGTFTAVEIPVPRANPRAVELAPNGDWWVALGGPHRIARYAVATRQWTTYDAGMYAHSVAIDATGRAWFSGHFTKAPEQIGWVDPATGAVATVALPSHPALATDPAGPIPYEIRVGPDGRVWTSELQGNRLIAYDPRTARSEAIDLPTTFSGPRRFDVARDGTIWIPAYTTNQLVALDPATKRFTSIDLPMRDAVPYIARVQPTTGRIWVGGSASDAVFELDPRTGRWSTYLLPTRGALIRHMAFDPRTGDAWVAYGASPGIPARIARITPQE
jgi:streptogramin lyase